MISRLIILVLMHFPIVVFAATYEENFQQKLNLSGSIRGGYFSSSANLDEKKDILNGAIWLKSSPVQSENVSMLVEGWATKDNVNNNESEQGRLREAYLNVKGDEIDFRVGKQIIIWGRADSINPTDNITPRNYTWLMPNESDQRIGPTAAKLTYNSGETAMTGIWLPLFLPNTVPLRAASGSYFSEEIPRGSQGAFKLNHFGAVVDWSISYFSGFDLNPDIRIGTVDLSGLNLILTHNRVRVFGMDAATVMGRYGLRAEAAYSWTSNEGIDDFLVKKSHLYLVVGGDRTFFDNFNINLQYYLRQVSNYRDPRGISDPLLRSVAIQGAVASNQLDPFQHGLTMRVANKWLNETLEGEFVCVYSLNYRDYALKPRLIYDFNDQLKGTVGMDIYRGESDTFFGRLRDISSFFAEMKYSF